MTTRLFVDTLLVVALVNPRDQGHAQALAISHLFEDRPLLITAAVILEIGNGLAKNDRAEAAKVIEGFFTSDNVEIVDLTPALIDEAFALYKSVRDKSWGLVDCVSFVAMRRAGATEALTSDHHLRQAGFRTLMDGSSS